MPNTLTIFKNSFVIGLKSEIGNNLRKYTMNQPWVADVGSKSQRDMATSLELKAPLNLLMPENDDLKDVENSIRIHKALPNLTLFQARDPRLWTRLTHADLWTYMRKRWPIERYLQDGTAKAEGRILERYFIPQSQSRSQLRNGIARLWWIAKLSHDPHRDNPYELTAVILSTLDITQTILERGLGRAPNVIKGFLEFLLRNREMLLSGGNENRVRIRHMAKFLNLYGGVCVLDCLSQTQIMALLEEEFSRIQKTEKASRS